MIESCLCWIIRKYKSWITIIIRLKTDIYSRFHELPELSDCIQVHKNNIFSFIKETDYGNNNNNLFPILHIKYSRHDAYQSLGLVSSFFEVVIFHYINCSLFHLFILSFFHHLFLFNPHFLRLSFLIILIVLFVIFSFFLHLFPFNFYVNFSLLSLFHFVISSLHLFVIINFVIILILSLFYIFLYLLVVFFHLLYFNS